MREIRVRQESENSAKLDGRYRYILWGGFWSCLLLLLVFLEVYFIDRRAPSGNRGEPPPGIEYLPGGFLLKTNSEGTGGLVWRRCPRGQNFRKGTCAGKIRTYTLAAIKTACLKLAPEGTWRPPTYAELESVANCNYRDLGACENIRDLSQEKRAVCKKLDCASEQTLYWSGEETRLCTYLPSSLPSSPAFGEKKRKTPEPLRGDCGRVIILGADCCRGYLGRGGLRPAQEKHFLRCVRAAVPADFNLKTSNSKL